jgi:hypothetical protein
VLEPYGFSADLSKYSTFYREVSGGIFHVIKPDLSNDGSWFDIRVFATTPLIEPDFNARFPDEVGIPSDSFSLLHSRFGIGARQQKFRCKTEEGFTRNFNKEVAPALVEKAIPYLDNISSINDLVPYIRRDFYLGAALLHVGEHEKAMKLLMAEKYRLSNINDDSSGRVPALLSYIDKILN